MFIYDEFDAFLDCGILTHGLTHTSINGWSGGAVTSPSLRRHTNRCSATGLPMRSSYARHRGLTERPTWSRVRWGCCSRKLGIA